MNWLAAILKALQLVPVVVAGIEQIHKDAPGATKKQLATEALTLATGVAGAVAPGEQDKINAFSTLISSTIDNTVAAFNTAGIFQKKA